MSLAIAMQVAPRRVVTVGDTLASLRGAGFSEAVHVFAEPGAQVPSDAAIHLHENAENQGAFRNWRQAASFLLTATAADWLLICQDDVQFAQRARRVLDQFLQSAPVAGFVSLYTSRAMVPAHVRTETKLTRGWCEATLHNNGFIGAQALCFPRESLHRLLEHDRFRRHNSHRKIDVIVARVLQESLHLPLWVHVPSLADHSGASNSTLGRDKIVGIQWLRRGLRFDPS